MAERKRKTARAVSDDRWVAGPNNRGNYRVMRRTEHPSPATDRCEAVVADYLSEADAHLLAFGRAALEAVRDRWTFTNDQCHTHTWHDWADCKPLIDAALGGRADG
jgi:hypothetical protein